LLKQYKDYDAKQMSQRVHVCKSCYNHRNNFVQFEGCALTNRNDETVADNRP